MTNRLAVFLFIAISLGVAFLALYDPADGLFLLRKFSELLNWVTFWR